MQSALGVDFALTRGLHPPPIRQIPINPTQLRRNLDRSTRQPISAYSGAQSDREGKFQVADGGTLFLDEIGDMEQLISAVVSEGDPGEEADRFLSSVQFD
jgi:hypothetical protein